MTNSKGFIRLEEIIWHMPGSVYWKDRNGIYQGCNQTQVQALGFRKASDIIGKKAKDLVNDPLLAETIEKVDREVMKSGKEYALEEGPLNLNGNISYYFTRKIPLHDSDNRVIGLLGISLDITKRKLLEQEMMEAKEAAEAASRAKTEFLANMSHDVKSPMAGIVTFAQLMMTDPSWRTPEKAEQVHASAEQVLNFFNSCLELSKLETSEFQSQKISFSLPILLEEIRALFVPRTQSKGLNFSIEYPSDLPKLFIGHRGSLYRVLLNLVGNAVKFTDHGEVTIRAFITEKLGNNTATIGIEVKDTGLGIPEDKHQIIFEKLHRLTPSYEGKVEGSGIGLYIVDQYVKHMNGQIRVASQLGKGSTFTILLPITIASETDFPEEQQRKKSIPHVDKITEKSSVNHHSSTIEHETLSKNAPLLLLVEDNPMIQIATKSLLDKAGFRVDVAKTGSEALELFSPEKYVFIFMAIGLPDLQGYEVAANMRQKEKLFNAAQYTPIIALTAHGAVDVERFCSKAGMQGVLSKPITPEKIDIMWRRYGQGENINVPELTLLDSAQNDHDQNSLPVIDFLGTVALAGSEEQANNLFELLKKELSEKYLDRLSEMVEKRDYPELRKELHGLLGALCYAKVPRLNAALSALQEDTRNMSHTINQSFQKVQNEAINFIRE